VSSHNPDIITRWVKASMQPIMKKKIIKEPVGTKKVTKTKGIFKKESYEAEETIYEEKEEWVPTGEYSDKEVNFQELTDLINNVCIEMTKMGYEVIQIMPINTGRYSWQYKEIGSSQRMELFSATTEKITGGGFGYGFGFGLTDGAIIVGKLK